MARIGSLTKSGDGCQADAFSKQLQILNHFAFKQLCTYGFNILTLSIDPYLPKQTVRTLIRLIVRAVCSGSTLFDNFPSLLAYFQLVKPTYSDFKYSNWERGQYFGYLPYLSITYEVGKADE